MTLSEVKQNLEKTVLYKGEEHVLKACRLFKHYANPEFKYSVEIVSVRTNTVMNVPLESVTVKKERKDKK